MIGVQSIIETHEKGFERRKRSAQLFDLDFWNKSESYKFLKDNTKQGENILEIGCLTGHHLLLLAKEGYKNLTGVDFLKSAIDWGENKAKELGVDVKFVCGHFPGVALDYHCHNLFDKIVLFDVIEHVSNLNSFLCKVTGLLKPKGEVLLIVPLGTHYSDEGHINFYPTIRCLENLLVHYFEIVKINFSDSDTKITAILRRRTEDG